MSDDMPVFLTPYLLVEGTVAEIVDCVAGPLITRTEDNRTFTYRSSLYEDERTDTMHGTLNIYAAYDYHPATDQLIGWLTIERIRSQCHLEMRAIVEYQQLACDVLLALPSMLEYLGPVRSTRLQRYEILQELKGDREPPSMKGVNLRALTETDRCILDICLNNPGLTLPQISERAGLSESATGNRYRSLVKMSLLPPLPRGRRHRRTSNK